MKVDIRENKRSWYESKIEENNVWRSVDSINSRVGIGKCRLRKVESLDHPESEHSNEGILTSVRPTLFPWGVWSNANRFSIETLRPPWTLLRPASNWQVSKIPWCHVWGVELGSFLIWGHPLTPFFPDPYFLLSSNGISNNTVSIWWYPLYAWWMGGAVVI